ncbi:hypothetical protein ACCO45_002627 [Purpureocillium lilacinum]|uniref:Uncharacterized protein n=1 Tax=Purpureocillium lilacinum TaxID=33203 RepID=A0ACC4EB74_PURLI
MFGTSATPEKAVSPSGNEILSRAAHALAAQDVVRELGSDEKSGLTEEEAAERLSKFGPNEFGEEKAIQPLKILIGQLFNAMTVVLALALAASFAIRAWVEGGVLAALILIDIVIGFFQDLQAARIVASLESLHSPTAHIWRSGLYETREATTIVPGDIIEFKTGDKIPADARLVDSVVLETDEALLTGESLPVPKNHSAILNDPNISPGDRMNVVLSSTVVTKGRGRAVVFATGCFTEIGLIAAALRMNQVESHEDELRPGYGNKAHLFAHAKRSLFKVWRAIGKFLGLTVGTPLQRQLSKLFLYVFAFAIICAIIVLAANKFDGRSDVIIYAIAVAVGTLPATLVLVLTVTMAVGTRVMMQRHVAVRNMRSLEALGGVTSMFQSGLIMYGADASMTDICSDKTGTLTQGRMVTKSAWLPGHGTYFVDSGDQPYNPDLGQLKLAAGQPSDHNDTADFCLTEKVQSGGLCHFLNIAALANNASLEQSDEDTIESWKAKGDPTEIAILVFAFRFGHRNNSALPMLEWEKIAEFPFDSTVKLMSVVCKYRDSGELQLFTKGATERVVERCSTISRDDDRTEDMNGKTKLAIMSNAKALAQQGLRVLALASKPVPSWSQDDPEKPALPRDRVECGLIFRGLIGIYDPLDLNRSLAWRPHRHSECYRHRSRHSPHRLDVLSADAARTTVMAAQDFDKLSDENVDKLAELPLVVARCTPKTKVRMVDALHRRGRYVAMTGDGVNDSPSLQRSDIGIAMGLNGSDVAKSASDIILMDDNFASILNAVEEGRRIFDNVQKFMLHVLAANVGLVITLLVGLAFRDGDDLSVFPLSPVEILFMMLVAGAFTENGLGFEAASPDILRRPPQNVTQTRHAAPEFLADLAVYGLVMAVCLLGSFVIVLYGLYGGQLGDDCNIEYSQQCDAAFRARSTCYVIMMWIFLFFAWELIDNRRSFFYGVVKDNKAWRQRLTNNKPLFWSVVIGFIVVFPTIYIPGLNHDAFCMGQSTKNGALFSRYSFSFFALARFGNGRKGLFEAKTSAGEDRGGSCGP